MGAYLAVFIVGGTVNSFLGLALETIVCPRYVRAREFVTLMAYVVLENFGYRQMTAWFRLRGFWNALRRRHTWGVMARRGHAAPEDVDSVKRAA